MAFIVSSSVLELGALRSLQALSQRSALSGERLQTGTTLNRPEDGVKDYLHVRTLHNHIEGGVRPLQSLIDRLDQSTSIIDSHLKTTESVGKLLEQAQTILRDARIAAKDAGESGSDSINGPDALHAAQLSDQFLEVFQQISFLIGDSGYDGQSLFTVADQQHRVRLGDSESELVIAGGHLLGLPADGGLFDQDLFAEDGSATYANIELTLENGDVYRFIDRGLPVYSDLLPTYAANSDFADPNLLPASTDLTVDSLFDHLDGFVRAATERNEHLAHRLGGQSDLIAVNRQHAQTIIDNSSGWLIATLEQPNTTEEAAIQSAAALRSELATQNIATFSNIRRSLLSSIFN